MAFSNTAALQVQIQEQGISAHPSLCNTNFLQLDMTFTCNDLCISVLKVLNQEGGARTCWFQNFNYL